MKKDREGNKEEVRVLDLSGNNKSRSCESPRANIYNTTLAQRSKMKQVLLKIICIKLRRKKNG